MGCITTVGRVILVILNMVFLLVSLAFIAAGAILKFFADKILPYIGDVDMVDKTIRDQLHVPSLDQVTELPFVGDIGIALLSFGCVLFLISFCACCGACCKFRPLLIVFIVLMTILVITQGVVGGLFLKKDSPLHEKIKDQLRDKVNDEYQEKGDNILSFAVNMLNYLLDCCGMTGVDDFPNNKPVLSCCKRTVLQADNTKCVNPASNPNYFNTQGCYDKLQDKILEKQTIAAVILGLILLMQTIEITFATMLVKEASSVGPV